MIENNYQKQESEILRIDHDKIFLKILVYFEGPDQANVEYYAIKKTDNGDYLTSIKCELTDLFVMDYGFDSNEKIQSRDDMDRVTVENIEHPVFAEKGDDSFILFLPIADSLTTLVCDKHYQDAKIIDNLAIENTTVAVNVKFRVKYTKIEGHKIVVTKESQDISNQLTMFQEKLKSRDIMPSNSVFNDTKRSPFRLKETYHPQKKKKSDAIKHTTPDKKIDSVNDKKKRIGLNSKKINIHNGTYLDKGHIENTEESRSEVGDSEDNNFEDYPVYTMKRN